MYNINTNCFTLILFIFVSKVSNRLQIRLHSKSKHLQYSFHYQLHCKTNLTDSWLI